MHCPIWIRSDFPGYLVQYREENKTMRRVRKRQTRAISVISVADHYSNDSYDHRGEVLKPLDPWDCDGGPFSMGTDSGGCRPTPAPTPVPTTESTDCWGSGRDNASHRPAHGHALDS